MAPPTAPVPTLFTADLPSDDEAGDEDFAPPSPTSSTTSSTTGINPAKRRKTSHSPPPSSVDEGPKAFSYSDLVQTAATAGAPNGQGASTADAVAMVTFTRERNFAGEIVLEQVTVPSTSPEALAHLASTSTVSDATSKPAAKVEPSPASGLDSSASIPPPPAPSASNPDPTSAQPPPPRPPARAPPKKRRTSALEATATAVKPKKMTTMEKSALDWKAASASLKEEERDELERNRRKGGAGYLEKMDFLGRVGDRLDGGGSSSSTGQGRRS